MLLLSSLLDLTFKLLLTSKKSKRRATKKNLTDRRKVDLVLQSKIRIQTMFVPLPPIGSMNGAWNPKQLVNRVV